MKLEFNKSNINKIMKFFGEDVKVIEKDWEYQIGEIETDRKKNRNKELFVNRKLSDVNKLLVVIHEMEHWSWGLHHDNLGRMIGFYSKLNKDKFTENIARVIFKKKIQWK